LGHRLSDAHAALAIASDALAAVQIRRVNAVVVALEALKPVALDEELASDVYVIPR
jgi:hypothetical protein